jgi:hypothetical protein
VVLASAAKQAPKNKKIPTDVIAGRDSDRREGEELIRSLSTFRSKDEPQRGKRIKKVAGSCIKPFDSL